MNRKLKDLIINPRIEIIPSLLNLPIVGILLAIIYIDPDFHPIINAEGAKIFGNALDYVSMIENIAYTIGAIILLNIILIFIRREKLPLIFHVLPIITLLGFSILFFTLLNGNDFFTINYIFQVLGRNISLIIYLSICIILVVIFSLLIYGLPRLWNYYSFHEKSKEDRNKRLERLMRTIKFRPKTISIISLIGFLIGLLYVYIIISGNSLFLFWSILLFRFNWDSALVKIYFFSIVLFFLVNIDKIKNWFLSKAVDEKFNAMKFINFLELSLIVIQLILIIILGISIGFEIALINPLSLVTLTEILVYILKHYIISSNNETHEMSLKDNISSTSKSRENQDIKRLKRVLFVISPMIWIILFQPVISLPPRPEIESNDLTIVKNSYSNLTISQKTIFDDFMNNRFPYGSNASDVMVSNKGTREWVRVASGLLFRNLPGDIKNASFIIQKILEAQYNNPGNKTHGVWMANLYSDKEKTDENWREFVGCELIIILEKHSDKLSLELINSIEQSLIYAAEGAYIRNVRPTYTNIAMMSAFLMEYVGTRMNLPNIRDGGIVKSWEVYLLFNRNNTFSEFNSPTYYGVDMLSLAMWRDLGPTTEMRRMGAEMEVLFWEEVSKFYHYEFRTLVGPYFRTYGIHMKNDHAIMGMWIGLLIDNLEIAPWRYGSYTNFECSNIFPMVQLGHSVPDQSVVNNFLNFSGPRYLKRLIPTDISSVGMDYEVSAMLESDWMMGGVSGFYKDSNQLVVGAIHWNSSISDSIAWLVVSGMDYLDVKVTKSSMNILQSSRTDNITFYVNCEGITEEMVSGLEWNLPGLDFTITGNSSQITAEEITNTVFRESFSFSSSQTILKITSNSEFITLFPEK
jgi:hypothetical protein